MGDELTLVGNLGDLKYAVLGILGFLLPSPFLLWAGVVIGLLSFHWSIRLLYTDSWFFLYLLCNEVEFSTRAESFGGLFLKKGVS